MKKRLLAILLTAAMLISLFAVGTIHSNAASSQYAQSTIQGGAVLHAMNWSYNTIKANLQDIYNAGYTAVQTSCIQPPKDYNSSWTDMAGQWWKFYQPIDICVADGNTWLGTKAELKALCTEADKYGIKIICDIVVNHMGSTDSGSGRSSQINSTLRNDESCWHNANKTATGNSHYEMTQWDLLNKPDLNSGSTKVQNMVIAMLKDAVDCGVDGFRFDAAQNIEVPNDDNCGSNFWPNVMGSINSYKSGLFSYGEMYYDAWGYIDQYLSSIGHVSEPIIGCEALLAARDGNAGKVTTVGYQNNRSASNNVVWVESHDSYFYGTGTERYGTTNTQNVDDKYVIRAWAIIGSRNDATSLFFARPNSTMQLASSDTTWKSTAVAEVNKFKNYFNGQSEYLSSSGSVAYNERGSKGVVISKLNGSGDVSLTAHTMSSGTYKDQITGNTFTVSGGKITGTVGSTGVAVVYNAPGSSAETFATTADGTLSKTYYLFGWINGADYACESDAANMGSYKFPAGSDGTLTATFNQKSYVAVKQENNANWYMTNGYPGNVTSATLYNTSITGDNSDKLPVPGNTKVTFTLTENADGSLTLSYQNYVEPTEEETDPATEPQTNPATEPVTTPSTEPETEPAGSGYYLVGSFNSWTASSDYEFSLKDESVGEYRLAGVTLYKGDEFKAKDESNHWYPDGVGNNFVVPQDGIYNVYFRPNGNGNSDWTSPYFYLSRKGDVTEAPQTEPQTDPATEPQTDVPTEPETEPETDPATEPETDAPETYVIGDADGDGEVSILDVTKIQKVIAAIDSDPDGRVSIRGKVELDGDVLNILDATTIQKFIANIPVSDCRDIETVTTY